MIFLRKVVPMLRDHALAFVLLGFWATSAQAQQQVFQLQICNRSKFQALFAFVSRENTQSSTFIIRGWYAIDPGPCRAFADFPKGWFYYYAEDPTHLKSWPGEAASFCIRRPGPWQATISAGYYCQSNELLKRFSGQNVTSDAYVVTLN
jgi:uncharacterized membrane protein